MISSVSKSCNDIYSYRPSSSTSKFETISLGTDISDNYISDPVSRKFTETSVSSLLDFKMMYSFITENAPKGQYVDLDAEFSKFLENRCIVSRTLSIATTTIFIVESLIFRGSSPPFLSVKKNIKVPQKSLKWTPTVLKSFSCFFNYSLCLACF